MHYDHETQQNINRAIQTRAKKYNRAKKYQPVEYPDHGYTDQNSSVVEDASQDGSS